MQALLAVLRFPFDPRRFAGAPSLRRTATERRPVRPDDRPTGPATRPFVAAPVATVIPTTLAPRLAAAPELSAEIAPTVAAPVARVIAPDLEAVSEPTEPRVSGRLRLSDPAGVRVVPFRPTTRWPLHRACARIYDPFRAFPDRGAQLAGWLENAPARR